MAAFLRINGCPTVKEVSAINVEVEHDRQRLFYLWENPETNSTKPPARTLPGKVEVRPSMPPGK